MLEKINSPEDLKKLNIEEKNKLAQEIREYVLQVVSENGGHLASNLGVVELTLALHSVFNMPKDKIIWDVGHQSYVHKIITGRREEFKTIRKLDGALTGGMALEALNDAGYSQTKMMVILNDNEMSISKNVGGLNLFLSKLRTKKLYKKSNISAKKVLNNVPAIGKPIVKVVQRIKRSIKQLVIPKMFFEDIGFTYLGPVDGHNIEQLENILKLSKQVEGPVLIHVLTKKGKGYKIAEENPDRFHATSPFDIETGKTKKEKKSDYSKVFGEKLVNLAKNNEKIVAITMAAGMAKEGMIPFVPIYSSFYQRAYDQVIHDVAIQNLPVIMCIDRAGLVGQDGETHQGLLDMAFFRLVPNLTIMAPKDFKELEEMMEFAITLKRPVVIRYPRGGEDTSIKFENQEKIELGKAQILKEGKDVSIIAIGNKVAKAMKMAKHYEIEGLDAEVINARFLKPLDVETIKKSIEKTKKVITIEDGTKINGLGTAIKELIIDENLKDVEIQELSLPDEFIRHGTVEELEGIYVPLGTFLFGTFCPIGDTSCKSK